MMIQFFGSFFCIAPAGSVRGVIRLTLHDAMYESPEEDRGGVQRAAQAEWSERRVLVGGPRRGIQTRSRYPRQCEQRPLSKTGRRKIVKDVT